MTKIDIISGFLGAGKTTLIQKLLKEAYQGEQVVLIENEFGEIGIDSGFLKEAGVEITEMNSGCICCSLVGDFGNALKDVLQQFHPDRIIIEPSGVGKLSDVKKAVEDVAHEVEVEINNMVAVVDATKCKIYMKNFGEFFNNQIEHADTIILSRTGKMSEEKLATCVKMLREHNETATIITTEWGEITGKQMVDACNSRSKLEEELIKEATHVHEHECGCGHDHHHEEHEHECSCGHDHHHEEHEHECGCEHDHHHEEHEHECSCGHDHHHEEHEHECSCGHDHHHEEHEHECSCGHDHHHEGHDHHHADEVFTSWGVETPRKYTEDEVKEALEILANTEEYGIILRAKGILPNVNGEWIYFDLVPGEYELRKGSPEVTGRLCVIGTKLAKENLLKLFSIE